MKLLGKGIKLLPKNLTNQMLELYKKWYCRNTLKHEDPCRQHMKNLPIYFYILQNLTMDLS